MIMFKQYANLGVSLTGEEMREVKGGAAAFAAILWECYDGAGGPYIVCKTSNPINVCPYSECFEIGNCAPTTACP